MGRGSRQLKAGTSHLLVPASLNLKLIKEWHPTKNGSLKPEDITRSSSQKVWWLCKQGHEWQTRVDSRRRRPKSKCPVCRNGDNNLNILYPDLVKEWHPTKNDPLLAKDFTKGSSQKVWWLCKQGHEWQSSVRTRARNTRCPYCYGKKLGFNNSLADLKPELSKEWHPTKNGSLKPDQVPLAYSQKVWWLCEQGHEWQRSVSHRAKSGNNCARCSPKGGFRNYKPGYLYLLYSEQYNCWQVGITNVPHKRIRHHKFQGFKIKEMIYFEEGKGARNAEKQILKAWREIDSPAIEQRLPYGGQTETISCRDLPDFELSGYVKDGKILTKEEITEALDYSNVI